eukprot:TRINITY_DN25946_c0_g1_i1.p1 TRINITY_DN25946_c0_g1~~TRINITY_DN25946_c0_g1_i1.p1  ORF type:complete len:316 (+),score=117.50 TRINITY_DN25946_c0_g1_i1:33-950(+)
MSEFLLYDDSERPAEVRIDPVVVISVLDHYVRRGTDQERVIGTLLGQRLADGSVEVLDCFPVPHSEGQDVAVDMQFHRNMFSLHGRASSKLQIIGWYSTGNEVNENTALIHNDFYWGEVGASPIHLTVDTCLEGGSMNIRAMQLESVTLSSEEKPLVCIFHRLPHRLLTKGTEKAGVELLLSSKNPDSLNDAATGLYSDLKGLEGTLTELDSMLSELGDYVGKVLNGDIAENAAVGRELLAAITSLPHIEGGEFRAMVQNSMQDLLMVVYLSSLTKTQLKISEKLQSIGKGHGVVPQRNDRSWNR